MRRTPAAVAALAVATLAVLVHAPPAAATGVATTEHPVTRWAQHTAQPATDLRRAVGDAEIVRAGLGEAAHGLAEITTLKARALRYLAVDVGVDPGAEAPVVLPGDGPEALLLDEIAQRPGLERGDLGQPVGRLAEADDLGVADGAAQVGCRLRGVLGPAGDRVFGGGDGGRGRRRRVDEDGEGGDGQGRDGGGCASHAGNCSGWPAARNPRAVDDGRTSVDVRMPSLRRVLPDETVDGLAQQVGVADVPGVLVVQVHDDAPQVR